MVDYWFSAIKSRKTFLEGQENVLKFRYSTSSEKNCIVILFQSAPPLVRIYPEGMHFRNRYF